ncbi:MAG TPA: HAMP domain-containing sensor histidine kinase, partial [Vicinamibacteria bacterium]|nr:HAMP domain-containing sensor histidine kinase [Vicinamibacteria bacterium]
RVAAGAAERRRAEEATRTARVAAEAANARLQETVRLKDDVVSIVAHDFRSPLTIIQGYSEALKGRIADPAMSEQLEVIHGQARYLARLAEDTLIMSRLEAGDLPLERTEVELVSLAREALDLRGDRGRLEAERPVTVAGDAQRLRQVLDNLLDNAAKYAPRDAVVHVKVGADEDSAYLAVTDQGTGIRAADLPRLFAKFSRLESARDSGIPGSGLGLYICRSIVEAHGGKIHVESAVDRGSTFTVRLPRAAREGAA